MRLHSHLNSAVRIIDQYEGKQPFSTFLKKYFSANKKFGSKDRKQIGHLCYCFFRLGKAMKETSAQERILTGLFLCSGESNDILKEVKPEWNERVGVPVAEKLLTANYPFSIYDVFPWKTELSGGINYEKFCESFFVQPSLYLRIRPGHQKQVKNKLLHAGISFNEIEAGCLSLSNASRVEHIVDLDKEAVVQDYNSQKTGEYVKAVFLNQKSEINAWDCCAGSGGKSLLLHDLIPNLHVTVSDIRESIIVNLEKRFAKAGIKKYDAFIADVGDFPESRAARAYLDDHSPFDLITCDAPCTGSGTWSRTPEQLYLFDEGKIEYYVSLQKRITSNVIPYLKPNGFFLYITCSVFKRENEQLIDFIRQQYELELVKMELLKGYDKKADTMFVAVLRKPL